MRASIKDTIRTNDNPETTIVERNVMSERGVHHATFLIERQLSAPVPDVFRALTTYDAKRLWQIDSKSWETFEFTVDAREGGREVWRGRNPDGPEIRTNVLYLDVIKDERIISAYETYAGQKKLSVSLATIELQARGAGTYMRYMEQGAFLDHVGSAKYREDAMGRLVGALEAYLQNQR
jgi:uncharacterized protein YndB with AHSA1/START domain